MRKTIVYFAFALLALPGFAQNTLPTNLQYVDSTKGDNSVKKDIYLFTKSTKSGLILRWAPSSPSVWLDGNKYGYVVERILLDDTDNKVFSPVGKRIFKPWPLNDWEPIVTEETPYRAAAAMTIYGKEEAAVPDNFADAAQDLLNRYSFALLSADLDFKAAEASGLGVLDTSAKKGNLYVYRVYMLDSMQNPVSDTITQLVIYGEPIEKTGPEAGISDELEKIVVVEWTIGEVGEQFSGYYIERSIDNGKTFVRRNKTPFLNMTTNIESNSNKARYTDSVEQNYKPYQYRVIGLDAFGEQSLASNVVSGMGRDKTPPESPQNFKTTVIEGETVGLNWSYDIVDFDFAGFIVYRSNDGENYVAITDLLPTKSLEYDDIKPNTRETNYYRVAAVDTAGNEGKSSVKFAITTDEKPPGPPTNLKADVDTAGYLVLQWDAPSDDDVRGYLVHYSNSENNDFTVKSGEYLPNTHFVDQLSLETLTESIYYYVIAVDYSFNPSIASEILEVEKPDIIPPNASIFKDYEVRSDGIYFSWNRSTSEDVESIVLSRKAENGAWEPINGFDQTNPSYFDKNVVSGTYYEYQLMTVDDAGNATVCPKNLHIRARSSFFLKETPVVTATKAKKNGVQIEITYSSAQDFQFVLYRAMGDARISTHVILPGLTTFVDTEIEKNISYRYSVKAIGKDGKESVMSPEVTITN